MRFVLYAELLIRVTNSRLLFCCCTRERVRVENRFFLWKVKGLEVGEKSCLIGRPKSQNCSQSLKPWLYHLISCIYNKPSDKNGRIRGMLINNMVRKFKDPKLVNDTPKTIHVNSHREVEEGDDFRGVFRDALSSFWVVFKRTCCRWKWNGT